MRLHVLSLPKWHAIYRCINHEDVQDMIVQSLDKPPRKRSFRTKGKGNVKYLAISRTRLQQPKEGKVMAKRKAKQKAEDQVEEEESLDDLEDLDELDEVEPDDEDEDADDDDDADEDEDEDEEDDDEEDLTDLPIGKLRTRAQAAGLSAAKAKKQKGDSGKAALAKYILKHEDEVDEDEEEEEEEEKPKPKKKGKKGKGKGGQAPPTRELPKGKLGAADVADIAGVDARAVRVFLRKNTDEFPKDEELGRYSFTKKEAQAVAKAFKKDAKKKATADDDE